MCRKILLGPVLTAICRDADSCVAHRGASKKVRLPLCIMTSGDTHKKTVALLDANDWFGMCGQLDIIKQEKVRPAADSALTLH